MGAFFGVMFGISALALFVVAFSNVAKGKIGTAVAFGLAGVFLAAIAGSFAVYVD